MIGLKQLITTKYRCRDLGWSEGVINLHSAAWLSA